MMRTLYSFTIIQSKQNHDCGPVRGNQWVPRDNTQPSQSEINRGGGRSMIWIFVMLSVILSSVMVYAITIVNTFCVISLLVSCAV